MVVLRFHLRRLVLSRFVALVAALVCNVAARATASAGNGGGLTRSTIRATLSKGPFVATASTEAEGTTTAATSSERRYEPRNDVNNQANNAVAVSSLTLSRDADSGRTRHRITSGMVTSRHARKQALLHRALQQRQPSNNATNGDNVANVSQAANSVCTAEQFVFDDCEYDADGACDADSILCKVNTDCFDCDPCQAFAASGCAACVAQPGCQHCSVPSMGVDICSSDSIVELVPAICSNTASDGTAYSTTCSSSDSVVSNSTTSPSAVATRGPGGTCALDDDTCPFQSDGYCNANDSTCAANSDCMDCHTCMTYRWDGCSACVGAGCVWCEADSVCISPEQEYNPSLFTCTVENGGFVTSCPTTPSSEPMAFPDPQYPSQLWMYQLINVLPVWEAGIIGTGIGIRINEDGVDSTHEEFSGKFSIEASCSIYEPAVLDARHRDGTTCASLAAGNGGANSPCAGGIAPGATLSSCRVVSVDPVGSGVELALEAANYSFLYSRMETMHISSNSHGIDPCRRLPTVERRERRHLQASMTECPFTSNSTFSPCLATSCAGVDWNSLTNGSESSSAGSTSCGLHVSEYCRVYFEGDVDACTSYMEIFARCEYSPQAQDQLDAMEKGIKEGRDGKGIIYIFAAGNTYSSGGDVNFEGALNSRYTISVGATGKDGIHASYSIRGAPLFISAPGGDFDTYTNNIVALAGGGCAEGGIGTAYATPIVSGVAALVLEVNLDLSWRDVQGIFAQTSRQVDPDDESWTTNSAGFHHSYLYGFGLVDAEAAVTAARTWPFFSPELQVIANSDTINLTIPDFRGGPATSSMTLETLDTFVIESAIVFLDLTHSTRGHLEIVLTSPSGTASILAPGQRPENSQTTEEWKLMTVRNWGEPANGEWTLSLVDQSEGDLSTCVDRAGWVLSFGTTNPVELDCGTFRRAEICANGAEGPGFVNIFSPFVANISDPALSNADGVSVTVACCVCGGGVPATALNNVLRSWTLAVYGRDGSADGLAVPAAAAPSSSGPAPAPTNTNTAKTSPPETLFPPPTDASSTASPADSTTTPPSPSVSSSSSQPVQGEDREDNDPVEHSTVSTTTTATNGSESPSTSTSPAPVVVDQTSGAASSPRFGFGSAPFLTWTTTAVTLALVVNYN